MINIANRKQIIIMLIIVIGLIASVYLVLNRQIFKSRASSAELPFSITQDNNGFRSELECHDNVCVTNSLDIFIKPKKPENQPNASVKAVITAPAPSGP